MRLFLPCLSSECCLECGPQLEPCNILELSGPFISYAYGVCRRSNLVRDSPREKEAGKGGGGVGWEVVGRRGGGEGGWGGASICALLLQDS